MNNLSIANKEILVVEDDPGIADLMIESFSMMGLSVVHINSGAKAIERIISNPPILIILDYSLPDMTAGDLVDEIHRQLGHMPPFIVTTGAGDEKIAVEMMKKNARDYIIKDYLFFDMLPAVTTRVLKEIDNEKALIEMRVEIKDRENLLKTVFEAATGIAFIICDLTDSNHNIIDISPGAEIIFGYIRSEMIGMPVSRLYGHQENKSGNKLSYEELFSNNLAKERKIEISMTRKSGESFPCLLTSYPLYDHSGDVYARLDVVIDIIEKKKEETDRKKLEMRIQNMQKLESLGVLAGGIAHDFNNLLMAIIGHAGLAMAKLPAESHIMKNLLEIERASLRAGELCNQMLAYAGKGKMVSHALNLSNTISDMTMMMDSAVSKKIRIIHDLNESRAIIDADSSQIKQIVMNLVVNSSEAIGDSPGLICIKVGTTGLSVRDLDDIWLGDTLPHGEYVYLSISDNGCGMDEDTKKRIFDPFFSTKFAGRGLGLAALLGIVKAHNGGIKLISEVNKGTTVIIYFPKYTDITDDKNITGKAHLIAQAEKGLILLVDDEENVRSVAKEMLETIGFKVITASDGHEAIDLFSNYKDEIQCVLLDHAMPKMDGAEAFDRIKNIKNDAVVVLSSGYSEYELEARFKNTGYSGFIQKPYRLSDLASRILKITTKNEASF